MKKLKTIFGSLYGPLTRIIHESLAMLLPKSYAKYMYKKIVHKKLNFNDPKDYNEKLEWLKINSDISQWTYCADKYKVREYIEQCGLRDILVKLYGVWEKAEEIDFSKLPEKFVLKTNHAFGTTILVKDKSQLEIEKTKKQLNKWVKQKYGLLTFEPHYFNIKRRIIAEELLQDNSNSKFSSSLIDYKFWCIHGEPDIIMVLYDRPNLTVGMDGTADKPHVRAAVYDLEWNFRPEIISGPLAIDTPIDVPKPKCFDEMIKICRILSKQFTTVRVDLYEVNNKIYFGELTFTPGGNRDYFTSEYFLKMGEKIDLSNVKRRSKRLIV